MFGADAVKDRLESLGYKVREEDVLSLAFSVESVRSTIKNEINWPDVPDGLEYVAINMAAGDFLLAKKTFAPKDLEAFDLDYAVKQVQLGDTSTTFAAGEGSQTPEQRLTGFINYLLSSGKDEFNAYRRIRW